MSGLKDAILAMDDLVREMVHFPEWGLAAWVRTFTAAELVTWQVECAKDDGSVDSTNIMARMVVRCLVDEDGNRIFEDSDAEALGRKSASAVKRAFDVAMRLNGLSDEDVEAIAGN